MLHSLLNVLFLLFWVQISLSANAPPYDGNYHGLWYPVGATSTPFAAAEGRLFKINGVVQYFTGKLNVTLGEQQVAETTLISLRLGANAWWVPRLRLNSDIDLVLNQFVESSLKVLRSWAFAIVAGNANIPPPQSSIYGSWFQLLNSSGTFVNYGTNGLRQLDYVVHAAEQNNIFLVLPLVDYNSGVGGIDLYDQVFGCNETQWYTAEVCQSAYRSYAETIINRYKASPAIFAWELMNEPRCHLDNESGCDTSIITTWASQTSAWIKSIDPNHMVTLGEEGFFTPKDGYGDGSYAYSGDDGVDFVDNIAISTLDYDTVHCYPVAYGYPASWGNTWIEQHNNAGEKAGKPVVIEEYGENASYTGVAAWQQTILKDNVEIAMDMIWDYAAHTKEIGSCQSNCPVYNDSLSLFYGTSKYQKYVIAHAKAMENKKVN